jgi:2-dehydro-3-deoxy-D-arabinonate dehydratase
VFVKAGPGWFRLPGETWDSVVNRPNLHDWLTAQIANGTLIDGTPDLSRLLPPIGSQEVWAAGVTYFRSRTARIEEAKSAGGGDFYDRVYDAARPELFFKATPHRVRGHGQPVRIRKDSKWNVPEPELALVVSAHGEIVGYTIGNDMSSRDIEGENPLYLPQAKVYDGSCALGPSVLVTSAPLAPETDVRLAIRRHGQVAFEGSTTLSSMKRQPKDLVEYLLRDNSFPHGCVLLTGTGIVPPDAFTLASGDEIAIAIEPIGTLVNTVA